MPKSSIAIPTVLKFLLIACLTAGVFGTSQAQEMPTPSPEMDILKADVGTWDCEIKMWPEPGADPVITKGKENNRMLGEFWLISDFEGNMMGMDFQGLGTTGFDSTKKKYVGSWMDSMSAQVMHIEGTWDEETKTLTMIGDAPDPSGNVQTHTMATCYKDEKRVFTMHMQPKGSAAEKMTKFFELTYTRTE